MNKKFKDKEISKQNMRLLILGIIFGLCILALVYRLFSLQIISGDTYLDNFVLKTTKDIIIPSSRGNIYDRNGELLAYNELAYSVTMEDVYESGKSKNATINSTIRKLIKIIESTGDSIINDFPIELDENGNFQFNVEGTTKLRFLADIYGHSNISNLKVEEETATADEVIAYLSGTSSYYGIGEYEIDEETGKKTFVPGLGYDKEEQLKVLTIRYALSSNGYQKYIATTVATDVSEETVAIISENIAELDGVEIVEDTLRRYVDSYYFSHIIGYAGKVSSTELSTLQESDPTYVRTDTVGKSGIEKVMELELQGEKGTQTVVVDNLGRVIETTDTVAAVAGNDVYLTIDKDLQIATYDILERQIAGILITKIINQKEFTLPDDSSTSNIRIPITDVYYALFNNNIIDPEHFQSENAGENEKAVYDAFLTKKEQVFEKLEKELTESMTIYSKLSDEYQTYQSYIVSLLSSDSCNLLPLSNIDTSDATYKAWRTEESISLSEYLHYVIAKGWIDVSKIELENQYADTEEIYQGLVDYIFNYLETDTEFHKRLYKYMIKQDKISGKQVTLLLWEQSVIDVDPDTIDNVQSGKLKAYDFMIQLIENLDITPAQLALDPCSGSCVVTDVKTGDVLAMVTYPSYDNNKLANSVDADYYKQLQNDLSNPLWDYATQQKTAPGSTFKMVTATAALEEEGIISTAGRITCTGAYDKLTDIYRCWIYPGAHGSLNVSGAITNSCNYFFYEIGYRLSTGENGYDGTLGIETLTKYADMYGLTETSGIEITESVPEVSSSYPVLSAIGQGSNNYTTVGLARYVTTVANRGTCYNLTLLNKLTDSNGNLLESYDAEVRNTVENKESTWDAIFTGMRGVILNKAYYSDMPVAVCGKTGTAQESAVRPDHALFVGFAPYEDPEVAIATRIAYGYSSNYAAEVSEYVLKAYFGVIDEQVDSEEALIPESSGTSHD